MEQETLWQKTVLELKQGMLSADNLTGTRFPSLSELSRDYGVSKITALRVVSELEKSGLVKRIPRRGTFIVGRHTSRSIKVLLDFDRDWPANALPIIWKYIRGIEVACRKAQCNMQVVSLDHVATSPSPDDKYIVLAPDPESAAYIGFSNKNCPHVFLHSPFRLAIHDCVRADHTSGGRVMTQCMLDAGHKRIAYIGGSPSSKWHAPRIKGYLDALDQNNLPLDMKLVGEITSSVPKTEDAAQAVEYLLALPDPPTAIVASDDLRALAIIAYLARKGLSVPGDIAVSGMDARVEAVERDVPLATCDWQLEKQGEVAVDILLYPPASGGSPKEVVIQPKFVPGRTV
jgi:DNA-binding LacI/PurR family transcriptional regulator